MYSRNSHTPASQVRAATKQKITAKLTSQNTQTRITHGLAIHRLGGYGGSPVTFDDAYAYRSTI